LDAASLSNIGELKWGTVKYGSFLSSVIGFLMIAFVIFLLIKFINAVQKRSVAGAPPPPTNEEVLLTQIRDLLKEKK
jgi:large conductance mechanosensitive channel